MAVEKVLSELKSMGDPRALESWKKMGMDTSTFYGVGLTKLKGYSRKVGKSHELAAELWATGIHDARLLATMIEEPDKVTEGQIDAWIADLDFWDLSDKLCTNVVAKTPFAGKKIKQWLKSKSEYARRAAFVLLAEMARNGDAIKDSEFEAYIELIEERIHKEKNWPREAMNWALICVGSRNKSLNRKALAAARRIGPVAVDYGDTSCKAPDALDHLTRERVVAKLK
jgi:3-methyladenine DNA glycosylase AlkD